MIVKQCQHFFVYSISDGLLLVIINYLYCSINFMHHLSTKALLCLSNSKNPFQSALSTSSFLSLRFKFLPSHTYLIQFYIQFHSFKACIAMYQQYHPKILSHSPLLLKRDCSPTSLSQVCASPKKKKSDILRERILGLYC